jgi:hypothetical protein
MHRQPAEIPFQFELPIEVWEKAGEKGKERRIGGIISTEDKDRQGEVVLQRGLDFSEFINHGWFNDNHSKDTTGIVGYPTKVEKQTVGGKPRHRVEGYLLPNYGPANKIWELARSLQKTNRRLGFSIEGSVGQREGYDGKTVAQAKVRNVAITNCPVNVSTGLEILAKSLVALETQGEQARKSHRCWGKGECCGKCESADAEKALSAGQAVTNPGPSAGEGFPLRTESTEKKPKRLTKAQAIEWLQSRYRGLSKAMAERIYQYAVKSAA